jgi:sulfite exporter TauE/SafE
MIFALLTGCIAGIIHVLSGPDHLAAVAPLAARRRYKVWKTGLLWGLGHTWAVWLIATAAVLARNAMPLDVISGWGDRLVGVALIFIGLMSLRRALSFRVHYHEHEHDNERHAHFHIHKRTHDDGRAHTHEHSHVPFGVGLLHGVAGGAHFVAILPAVALPSLASGVSYVAGYGIGTILAMTMFAWAVGRVIAPWMRRHSTAYNVTLTFISLVAVAVGVFWLVNAT